MAVESEALRLEKFALIAALTKGEPFTVEFSRVVLSSAIIIVFILVHKHYANPLSKISSVHWSAPWSRCYILWQVYIDRRRFAHYEGHINESGHIQPVVRVAPNEISIMTLAGLDAVYKAGFDRSSHYQVFQNYGSLNMFCFQHRAIHTARKRVVAPAYSKSSMCAPRVQRIVRDNVSKLVNFLEHQVRTGSNGHQSGSLMARNVFRALAVDVITAFAFSESTGTKFLDRLQSGPNTMQQIGMDDFALWNQDERDPFFFFESQPGFNSFLPCFAPQAKSTHARMEAYMLRLIGRYENELSQGAASEKESTVPSDHGPYYRLLNAKDSLSGQGLSWRERASEILDHIGAGYDPVACLLEFVLQKISQFPECQIRLRNELRQRLPSVPEDRIFSIIDSLPYLDAIVLESLRTIASIETYQPRVVPSGGCTIEGYYLPEGTVVSSQPYLINNHPDIFESPFEFNPNRWLVASEDYNRLRSRLWTFSSGPRACIGRNLAMTIIKITLAEILYLFKTTVLPDDKKTWTFGQEGGKAEFYVTKA